MKKLFVFMITLALVALALPALADDYINGGGGGAYNNMVGDDATDNSINKGANGSTAVGAGATANLYSDNDVLSGNTANLSDESWDITVKTNFKNNDTTVAGSNNTLGVSLTVTDSLNGNNVYVGSMTQAWQNQHQYEHQFDHQVYFPTTFQNAADLTAFMPISNVHMQQSNTGVTTGANAGSVSQGVVQFGVETTTMSGMFVTNQNMGGVGTNQTMVNVVTAFSAP